MSAIREEHRVGIDYLRTATELLQRVRDAHPTKGLYEAADLQWWWSRQRSTDGVRQPFWFDEDDRPVAAMIATEWGDGSSGIFAATTLAPVVMPDAPPEWIAHVIDRGMAHMAASGIDTVELEVDRNDETTRDVLTTRGFEVKDEGLVEAWIASDARPVVSALHEDYGLAARVDATDRPHPMVGRSGPDVERRLGETSLYRPDLDLAIFDRDGDPAAYGIFWYDPATATGMVEPMRTEDEHQRRGLARHVLTSGLERLAAAGAQRIKICYEPGNPAAGHLYRSVGFVPVKQTDVFAGSTDAPASSPASSRGPSVKST